MLQKLRQKKPPNCLFQQHHRDRSIQLAEFSAQERYVLGLIRRSQDYTPNILLDAWREYQAKHRPRRSFAIAKLYEAFYARQVKENRSEANIERRPLALEIDSPLSF